MLLFNACLYLVFRLNAVVNSMAYGICHLLKYRNTFYLYKHIVACFLWVFYVSLVLLCSSHLRFYVLFVIVWLSWLIFMYFFPIFGILCFNWCCSVHPVCDLQLHVQSVPTTTNVVSSNPVHVEVYSIQHYVIKFFSDVATGRWFSPNSPVSFTNKTDRHDITEILLKEALNAINHKSQPILAFI